MLFHKYLFLSFPVHFVVFAYIQISSSSDINLGYLIYLIAQNLKFFLEEKHNFLQIVQNKFRYMLYNCVYIEWIHTSYI